ncbi:MAG: tRNA (adenosine(37)-N6)-threonylcarbamoyltransferase complex ATPase subunit type 1 TsaE [Eubacteriales bacterium]|nr:tRNA (adenosine(37)-N6)-threonylcarbamoyltransferase complex ATPase subunit type 1 TsaE [Bacillota bacterium]MBV1727617.1 tRNA (adenosine(37)-N6)-threonylcarbamoyltransferase complex ATPase subunit type 1 TsaE [Desulforudis sp.]MDP3049974.1 tRNA (adenosine(37)-N6)-threonylcarbamoyltransferase complex ATPase subunit type 1 TsaE [Eubacteriales bacterium]MDQ7790123.1 tRNA (adenosine(37)-N6)-threonylcarbamoyltransferase complex ATPase subunit type 1 TsaE [Clostridia bacterium]MBU4534211.1 tRNA (
MFKLTSNSPKETREIGRTLGPLLEPGDILCLYGQLGAGKTALAQGVALGLDIEGPVTSPTFILINEYEGRLPLYHFDAYRLEGAADFALLGYEEYFYDEGVSLVEWADRVTEVLPRERLDIEIEADGEERRRLCFNPHGKRYLALVEDLKKHARTWD